MDDTGDAPPASPTAGNAPFLTVSEAAQMLRLSPTSVQMLVERGLLKAWRTAGGHRRIVPSSVTELLRRQGVEPAAASGAPAAAPATAAVPGPAAPARAGLDLLVAEDDADLVNLYRARLGQMKPAPEIRIAGDGVRTLLAIGERVPDVLILDLGLPGISGMEALTALRADPRTARMPVVVVSGMRFDQMAALGPLPVGTLVLAKPVPFERLVGMLEAFAAARTLAAR